MKLTAENLMAARAFALVAGYSHAAGWTAQYALGGHGLLKCPKLGGMPFGPL